jgi:hypothetical protein
MASTFTCPECGRKGVSARAGATVRCPHCDKQVTLPAPLLSGPLIPPPPDGTPSIQKPKSIPWEEVKGFVVVAIAGLISFLVVYLIISWVD